MIKKITYIVVLPACMSLSVAMAESNPLLLSSNQMDQVTAGLSADVGATALATSPILALTKVNTVAEVAASKNNPGAGGAAAAGIAVAAGAGQGSWTYTSVSPATSQTGPNTQAIQVNINQSNQLVSVSGSGVVSVNTLYNPL
jgi:hypothetical protein